jgi:PAS domain S-box-containing protein
MAGEAGEVRALAVEEALGESERRYRLLAENAEDVIWTADNDWRFTYISPSIVRLRGFSPEEAMRQGMAETMTLESFALVLQSRREAQEAEARGEPAARQRVVVEQYRKDGSTVWVESIVKPQYDEQGRAIGFIGVSRDVTERKRAEEALGDARQFLKAVMDSISAVIFVKDHRHRLIHVNKTASALAGRTREQIVGGTDYDFFPKEQADFFWECDHQVLKTGRESVSEDVFVDSRGVARTLFAKRTRFSGKNGEKFVVGVATDITELKQVEAALRDSATKFQGLFENSPIGILIFNAAGVVLDANRALEATFGTSREQYLGVRLLEAMAEGRHKEAIIQAIREGEAQAEGWHEAIFSGQKVFLKARINRIAQDLYMSFLEDISQAKRLELSLVAAKDSAEEAARAKSEFLANMSHEIRTPLNAVLGLLQILELSELTGQQRQYVAGALESGKSLLTLIGDILDLAKIEAGKVEIARRPFAPAAVLDTVAGAFREQAEAKGVSLLHVLEASLPSRVIGDEIRLRQVLFNLVGNAVKFTSSGCVRIAASASGPDFSGSFCLSFCVTDTGVGIPADKLNKVFDPFTQADGTFTRRHQGTGLGLSIVKRLVELMGGTVELRSEEGRGTTATVAIAFEVPPEAAAATAVAGSRPEPERPDGLHVLLVEDDALNLLAVKEMLSLAGHRVTCATNGELALAALRTRRFDLALMDIQMPVLDGLETTRRIRRGEAGRHKDIPIIALSAHAMKGDRETFLAAGMNGYIAKPVVIETLEQAIADCLAARGPSDAAPWA